MEGEKKNPPSRRPWMEESVEDIRQKFRRRQAFFESSNVLIPNFPLDGHSISCPYMT